MASRFTVRGEAADSVAEYLRYRQIVGDADGGVPFTEKEYEVCVSLLVVDKSSSKIDQYKQHNGHCMLKCCPTGHRGRVYYSDVHTCHSFFFVSFAIILILFFHGNLWVNLSVVTFLSCACNRNSKQSEELSTVGLQGPSDRHSPPKLKSWQSTNNDIRYSGSL